MKHSFSTLHDHVVQIYEHFNIINPDSKPHDKKKIQVNDTHYLEILSHNSDVSYGLIEQNHHHYILNLTQSNSEARSGRVNLSQTDYFHYINFDTAVKLFDEFKLEDVILKESNKLATILNYDFTQDFPQRKKIQASNQTEMVISQVKDNVQIDILLPSLYKNSQNKFDGPYDWRKIKDVFTCFASVKGRIEVANGTQAIEQFKQFFNDIDTIPLQLLTNDIRFPLQKFKSDLQEMNSFIYSLDNNKKLKP